MNRDERETGRTLKKQRPSACHHERTPAEKFKAERPNRPIGEPNGIQPARLIEA